MIICKTKGEVKERLAGWRAEGLSVGAAPTMGALHEGHLSLIDVVKTKSDRAVATIFVNPLQFGPNEDLETYPRDLEKDLELLKARGCDLVFTPDRDALFAADFSTNISVGGLRENHCAVARPQFFDGVATIVAKLLLILRPDCAAFGEKDYQQLMVIKRMVRDLDMDVDIIGAPIVRESDGLAMSSRNLYLSDAERKAAPALIESISYAASQLEQGSGEWAPVKASAIKQIEEFGALKTEYVNLVDAETLELLDVADRPARILSAAWFGKTRLIDNVPVRVTKP